MLFVEKQNGNVMNICDDSDILYLCDISLISFVFSIRVSVFFISKWQLKSQQVGKRFVNWFRKSYEKLICMGAVCVTVIENLKLLTCFQKLHELTKRVV